MDSDEGDLVKYDEVMVSQFIMQFSYTLHIWPQGLYILVALPGLVERLPDLRGNVRPC